MKKLQLSFDWASLKHAYAWRERDSGSGAEGFVDADPESFQEWFRALRARFPQHHIEVIVEMSKGALIWMLKDYENLTIYPLSPISSCNYRKACCPSGAKDDDSDARLWLDYLDKHRDQLRPLEVSSEQSLLLDRLTRARRSFVDQQTAALLRLRALLGEYFPQAIELAGDLRHPLAWAFLERWPHLQSLQEADHEELVALYRKHRLRRTTIQERLELLARARPISKDPALRQSSILTMRGLVAQIRVLGEAVGQHEKAISQALKDCEPSKRALVQSVPGAGPALAPRLFVALDYLSSLGNAAEAAAFCGVSPVRQRSGKKTVVTRRYARPKFLHQSLLELADQTRRHSAWARAYYLHRKKRGHAHWSIMRSLAQKWLRVLLRCWQQDLPYDENVYIQTLTRRGSPYIPGTST